MSEPVVTKAIAEVVPADERADAPNGAFELILSAPTEDRDGETLLPTEWEQPLPEHITFDIDHGMSVATTVGSGTPRLDDDGLLRVSGTYASTPLAQQTRSLVNERHIRTASVAFLPKTRSAKDGRREVRRELLNGAFVAIPSNREAVVLSSKSFDAIEKAGARNSKMDAEHLQAAHDHLTAAGAACGDGSKSVDVDGKAVLGVPGLTAPARADESTAALAQAVDAAIDQALELVAALDYSTVPPNVAQAIALIRAADTSVDALLVLLGVSDPDEGRSANVTATVPATATRAVAETVAATNQARAASYRALQTL